MRDELGERARGIVATFASSIGALDVQAKHLLALASRCAPSIAITESLLARAFGAEEKDEDEDSFDKALKVLARASLLSRRQEDGHWQIHGLVAQAALSLLAPDSIALDVAMADALLEQLAIIGSDASQARGLGADAAQAEHVVERHHNQIGVRLLLRLGQCHVGRGQYGLAQATGTQALALATEKLGAAHPATLISMHNLAKTLRAQGDLARARELHEQVLAASRRVLGEEHPDTSISAWSLFLTLHQSEDTDAAKQVLRGDLLWLAERDPAQLGRAQRTIRGYVRQELGLDQDESSAMP